MTLSRRSNPPGRDDTMQKGMSKGPYVLRTIKSRAQFDWLLDHLQTEACRAGDNWHLRAALDAALTDYCREINQTPVFWQLINQALQDSVVLRLGRLYDPSKGALSLGNFLRTIQDHPGNRTLAALGLRVSGLEIASVEADLKDVSADDPVVSRLMEIRNQYLAHRQARLVSSGTFASLPELRQIDIETLLDTACRIATKYSHLYRRPMLSQRILGADDYRHMITLLRLGLQSLDAKHAAELTF